ncbi:MAG TPA: hypothetical protein VGQ37_07680 [Vicinamibacterales bacterium]|nr:hypothetical protein [Vicinamibacterales bacterium]
MSHLGDVVWLSQNSLADAMGEFGAEDDQVTRPLSESLFQRVAAVSRIALPKAPPPEEPVPVPVVVPDVAPVMVSAAVPAAPEPAASAEPTSAPAPALVPAPVQRGRWFVGVAVLGLLTLGQAPFVVLWALQSASAPIAIQVTPPPMAFASAVPVPVPVPVERTLVPPPRPAAPAAAKPAPAGSLSGWLHVEVPVPMRITEEGRLLGTTDVDRLMLPTGDHVLDLRNDELGFATHQMVTIKAGESAILPVRLPSASISINAKPWAEAWVDGERVGDTPIGTLMRTIGRHEVVLRHPELGERRVPVLVTMGQPARVSVDFKAGK